jgi:hypothetical protein
MRPMVFALAILAFQAQHTALAEEALRPEIQRAIKSAETAATDAGKKAAFARQWQEKAQSTAQRAREAAIRGEANIAGHGILTGTGTSDARPIWRYAGQVRAGKENGLGVEVWTSGERNEGEFRNDAEHGAVVSIYATGGRYEGEFRNARRSGAGVYTWTDGDRYEGEWQNASRNGMGIYYGGESKNYASKSGQWINSRLTGDAVVVFKDGSRFIGSFLDDVLDGYGVKIDPEGRILEQGRYDRGELRDETSP